MHIIDVPASTPYQVHLGTRLLEQAGPLVRAAAGGVKAAIITDSNVGPLYAPIVERSLRDAGYETCTFTFAAGEEHKRADTLVAALEFLATHELDRGDVVVALGGGVTGDMGGLTAALYMRGIALAQMPTSLLAMVDSSVGGKTAIDLVAGKNLAGAFWQPRVVIADIGCLGTLTPEQFADGCGEIVKHAVIRDPALFAQLEQTPPTYEALCGPGGVSLMEAVVARNVEIKRDVVAGDEREAGGRKLLNFGHSIGHAVEACGQYRLGHGNCVAVGMCLMARAAIARGLCDPGLLARLTRLLGACGLATRTDFTADELYERALHDKKRAGGTIDLVVPHALGDCSIERTPLGDFKALIAQALEAQNGAGDPAAPAAHPTTTDKEAAC